MSLERDGKFANIEISTTLERNLLSDADKRLYTRLVYGVIEKRMTLDEIITQYSKTPLDKLDGDVKTALRLGIYQLTYMDKIPPHAAVGETAGLVIPTKRGYVNAVLRTYLREGKKFTLPDAADRLRYLEVKYSIPTGMIKILASTCGGDELEALLSSLSREPKTALRINTLKISVKEAAEKLGGTLSSLSPDTVLTDTLDEVAREGILRGLWFVQDESSSAVAAAVGAVPGDVVVDTCACPGGKSFSMAIHMQNRGTLYAYDLHRNKLSLVSNGAARLGIDIIKTGERDARCPDESLIGRADCVLCDAPCSGLGVIAKKPDIRYKDIAPIRLLPEIQYGVLCGSSAYVRCGGVLVYSTCTLNRAENEDVVNVFLAAHPEFSLCEDKLLGCGMRTFLPHRDNCDGFFAAKMVKSSKV